MQLQTRGTSKLSLHIPAQAADRPRQPQAQTRQPQTRYSSADRTVIASGRTFMLKLDLPAQRRQPKPRHSSTNRAVPDRTFSSQISKLRPALTRKPQTRHLSQIKKNQTGHQSTARYNILASGPTCSEASERHAGSDRIVLDQTSQLKPHSVRQNTQAQTEHSTPEGPTSDQKDPRQARRTRPHQTGHLHSDWPGAAGHPNSYPPSLRQHRPKVTFKSRPDSHKDQTSRLRQNSLRPDI